MKKSAKSIYTFLDIGTSKVACLMTRMNEGAEPEIIAHISVQAKGIQNGVIWDSEAAKLCVDNALRQAEKMAGRRISSVFVNISSGEMKSLQLYDETDIQGGRAITEEDIQKLVDGILSTQIPPEEEILHAIPIGYAVDNEKGRTDPRGIHGNTLGAWVHVITIPQTQTMNLLKVLDWCHVTVAAKVATPYAAALAVLNEEEMDLGTTLIDFGAGTTSYAILIGGGLMQLGTLPLGSADITRAIAQNFNTDMPSAERQKVLNGAAMIAPRDEVNPVILPILGDETGTNIQIMRSQLIQTILPHLDNILNKLKESFENGAGFTAVANRYVLTGGGSGLDGLADKVGTFFGGIARIGKKKQIKNLPNTDDSCTFNICVGLLVYAKHRMQNKVLDNFHEKPVVYDWLRKVKEWLKHNL